MGVMGSLPSAVQLSHLFIGPQQILISQGLTKPDNSTGSWVIKSCRTTFARPMRTDRITKNGVVTKRTKLWPIGLGREETITIKPMEDGKPQELFNNLELYLVNHEGHFLKRIGNQLYALPPKLSSSGRHLRDKDGQIEFGEKKLVDEKSPDGKACGLVYVKPRLKVRVNSFLLHKRFIVNPRLILVSMCSGLFDTGIYYIGKGIGRRDIISSKVLNLPSRHTHQDKVIANNFLPIPIESPDKVVKDMTKSAQDSADVSAANPPAQAAAKVSRTSPPQANTPAPQPAPAQSPGQFTPPPGYQNACFITASTFV